VGRGPLPSILGSVEKRSGVMFFSVKMTQFVLKNNNNWLQLFRATICVTQDVQTDWVQWGLLLGMITATIIQVSLIRQGRREGGARGTCPLRNATLEKFSLKSMKFVTVNKFLAYFSGSGVFAPDPTRSSLPVWTTLVTKNHSFVPSETNS